MTSETAHDVTDDDRRLAREWASNVRRHADKHFPAERAIARVILNAVPAPPRPTLENLTPEERSACKWMQADVTNHSTRYVITSPCDEDDEAELLAADGKIEWILPEYVTPRPDLPRLEWPGNKKPTPAPVLPGGWRLADHPDYGRGIVTNTTPNRAGNVCFVIPAVGGDPLGFEWHTCSPDDLTYIDQGADQ